MEDRSVQQSSTLLRVGCVVIGKDEGEKLLNSLKSLSTYCRLVYVDSASADRSAERARAMGINVVELDMTQPFTAGRARNQGVERLLQEHQNIEFIQFLDGDCELEKSWLTHAVNFMDLNKKHAVVCGQLKEKFPEKSIYNWLCQIEWDTPRGDVHSCGGVALVRVDAFKDIGGFRLGLIAGEEPEMCFRLRSRGWKIKKTNQNMAYHDAEMYKFKQWFNRASRAGYAYAEGSSLHGDSEEKYWVKDTLSIWGWGLILPLFISVLCQFSMVFIALTLIYPFQCVRIASSKKELLARRYLWAFFIMLGKFPQAVGLLRFYASKYKDSHELKR
ncbi:hypothetical protein A9Q78_10510 [Methylophaga sp. 41_12_T18]|nr:hypothetical protein A9Q78_10510 [Methylophaga sp. 41_12_T18]